jgi:hypothetical protein
MEKKEGKMPDLTSEERQRIYEEEKAKRKFQEKVPQEKKPSSQKNVGIGCLAIIIIVAVIYFIGELGPNKSGTSSSKSSTIDLNAKAEFTDTQFTITNNDSFNWTSVELELNEGLIRSGYKLTTPLMAAGQTYTVGAMQFAKPDGTRFNPFQIKPQSITITCDTPKGKGLYIGSWK